MQRKLAFYEQASAYTNNRPYPYRFTLDLQPAPWVDHDFRGGSDTVSPAEVWLQVDSKYIIMSSKHPLKSKCGTAAAKPLQISLSNG